MNQDGDCELCIRDPGYETNLYLTASLRDMIYIWRGDLRLGAAIDSGRLDVHGEAMARRALPRWFSICALSEVESQRRESQAA